jgi:hypothetical protein
MNIDTIVAWYDCQSNKKKWDFASNESELLQIVEVAKKECDSCFGVMIFNMDDVLNKNTEIPWEKIG